MSKEQSAKMALIRRGRKAKRYTLETHDELIRLMRERLPIRLREKHYANGKLTEATERMLRDIGVDPKLADAINRKYQESGGIAEEDWLVMRRFNNLSAALEDNLHCSPLPAWEIRNGSDYNAAFMHAIKRSYPDENLSRREWAQRLGTGTRVISELQKRAGILTEEQYCIVPIKLKGDLKQQVRKAESENRGYCHYLSAQIGGREERIGLESPHLERWLRAVRASKATVQAVMQVVNRQWIESDEKPEVAQRPSAERKPADSRRARPQVEQEFGARYDRNWLFEQFSQGVRQVCGYRVNRKFVLNPATGEVLHQHPTTAQLADLILAHPADNAPVRDDFILWIEQELGGRVREA